MAEKQTDLNHVRELGRKIKLLVLDVDGVLTDGRLHFDAKGNEFKVFHAHDGYGIRRVLDAGIEVAIISGRKSKAVEKRALELSIPHFHLGVSDKIAVLQDLVEKMNLTMNEVACVGDDAPDLACLEAAGLAVAVANAHSCLDSVADWHTNNAGGMGAVREVCDLLLEVRTGA